jgi:hypothetical protein
MVSDSTADRPWSPLDKYWSPLSREVSLLEAGLGGPLVRHGASSPDYSQRSVARLSKRGQEKTWPATAQ